MTRGAILCACVMLAACAAPPPRPDVVREKIGEELAQAAQERKSMEAAKSAEASLLPPLAVALPPQENGEPRFDLAVVNAPAAQVFMAIVTGTKYNMLVGPEVTGNITVNLKDVTVREALEAIRELYGYEFSIQGNRIAIQPNTLQTRVYQVDYLAMARRGDSTLAVGSGAQSQSQSAGQTVSSNPTAGSNVLATSSTPQSQTYDPSGSNVRTDNNIDFWSELQKTLEKLVGVGEPQASGQQGGGGGNPVSAESPRVIVNKISGTVVVRARPRELRLVEEYLNSSKRSTRRQVMIEAKIVEVRLKEGSQAGINWASFRGSTSLGVMQPGTELRPRGSYLLPNLNSALTPPAPYYLTRPPTTTTTATTTAQTTGQSSPTPSQSTVTQTVTTTPPGTTTTTVTDTATTNNSVSYTNSSNTSSSTVSGATEQYWQYRNALASTALQGVAGVGGMLAASALGNGFVGLAFQAANFAALLNFLETQGNVSVLSSPRVATLNNQKAVLKVGTDEVYVTGFTMSSSSSTSGATTTTTPLPTPQTSRLFSGISLDVTPQIDEEGNIVLHVHPAISTVREVQKTFNLGSAGLVSMPFASREVNETDSIVRVQDGNIVAIGGMMHQYYASDRSGLPGTTHSPFGVITGQRGSELVKSEMVILLKPTIIESDQTWVKDLEQSGERLRNFDFPPLAVPLQ